MPLDIPAESKVSTADNGLFAAILNRLPDETRGLFSEGHLDALKKACRGLRWGQHPVDIRLSIPSLFRRYYIVLLAGPERRSAERRAEEKQRHPFGKLANLLFVAMILALGVYLAVFVETLIFISYYKFVAT